MSTDQVQDKPEQAREKIVDGMLNKHFFGKRVLADQEWIHDDSLSVARALESEGAQVVEFQRVALTG